MLEIASTIASRFMAILSSMCMHIKNLSDDGFAAQPAHLDVRGPGDTASSRGYRLIKTSGEPAVAMQNTGHERGKDVDQDADRERYHGGAGAAAGQDRGRT